ncbi:MAG: yfcF 1 [Burkholderiaceae bacterium]|nr:yfcF 1 [Burkholderiaceae bacterium]
MELYIGNKNYSSWSLRPWLLMKHFDIPFTEHVVGVAGRGANDLHHGYSKNGLVPCLHIENGFQIWDTLAIAEYLAETYPEKHLYPIDKFARARARSISAEMHSGFANLRGAMGMNIKMRLKGAEPSVEVTKDIQRVVEIWTDARCEFGQTTGKPYLFGGFSVADAMFAPVIWRFFSYNVALEGEAKAYLETMLAHPLMQAWEQSALAETVALAHYDDAALANYGGLR